jgi:hypothetical protein
MPTEDLDMYKDYTYIMYIICDKTGSFYSKIKNIVNIPIVVCSTCLSIVNGSEFDQDLEKMLMVRYVSIGFNLLIALSIAILNFYKIAEKEYAFKSQAMSFLKLYNKIDAESTKSKTTMSEFDMISIVNEYNLLCEYITFHIPSHIRKNIEKKYSGCKFPFLLINTKQRKPSVSSDHKVTASPPAKQPAQQNAPTSPTTSSSSTTDVRIDEFFDNYFIEEQDVPAEIEDTKPVRAQSPVYQGSPFSILSESMLYSPLYALRMNPAKSFTLKKVHHIQLDKLSRSSDSLNQT